jgi:hypothetical protein
MTDELAELVSKSLRTLLAETMFRADAKGGFLLNPDDPGFVETLKPLSAKQASTPPGAGRKPIVSHANHVLFGLELIERAVGGDQRAFEGADWDAAWRLERVDDAQWADLLRRLEAAAKRVLDSAPQLREWNELMLTGLFASAAHTAYHLGAIRQMLKDLR